MASFPNRTPPINATGLFVLRTPFTAPSTAIYRCEAIRGFNEIEERGINVYNSYYAPMGLSMAIYESDQVEDINIVTIIKVDGTGGEEVIDVPSSYIISYPAQLDVPYGRVLFVLDIGPVPETVDFSNVLNECVMVATEISGKTATGYIAVVPVAGRVTKAQNKDLEAGRLVAIGSKIDSYAQMVGAKTELAKNATQLGGIKDVLKNMV